MQQKPKPEPKKPEYHRPLSSRMKMHQARMRAVMAQLRERPA